MHFSTACIGVLIGGVQKTRPETAEKRKERKKRKKKQRTGNARSVSLPIPAPTEKRKARPELAVAQLSQTSSAQTTTKALGRRPEEGKQIISPPRRYREGEGEPTVSASAPIHIYVRRCIRKPALWQSDPSIASTPHSASHRWKPTHRSGRSTARSATPAAHRRPRWDLERKKKR